MSNHTGMVILQNVEDRCMLVEMQRPAYCVCCGEDLKPGARAWSYLERPVAGNYVECGPCRYGDEAWRAICAQVAENKSEAPAKRFVVTVCRRVFEKATVIVEAATETDAEKLALEGNVTRDWHYLTEDEASPREVLETKDVSYQFTKDA